MPDRVQLSRAKGWRMPENTVKVDRSTKWGNPFTIGDARRLETGATFLQEEVKDAETAVRFFRDMLEYQNRPYPTEAEIRTELRGKNLACWCKPGAPCHVDVLLEIANA
ncbi:DUF4326 domain-containing protein [Pararhodobacter zhoushanensis]|uniref:DUF4326 domain-containing protein n=1 Tax=Pararhodobacter zhoushanensis TaxID=2479545 RepID=A0ABT3GYK3_9RHOB|nr:DUF4326 domain-containing protein [Pararhodobacter zhoushanensis]MCW1932649.1 DUF4326 domain-containing protein [Pararhodobacter zhoushanensis]